MIKQVIAYFIIMLCLSAVSQADIRFNWENEGDQELPSIANLSNGNMAVAWCQSGPGMEGRLYYNILQPDMCLRFFMEEPISDTIMPYGARVMVAGSANGFFVAAYTRSYQEMDSSIDVFIRKFDNYGFPISNEIRLNNDTLGQQSINSLFLDDEQDMIIAVWEIYNEENPDLYQYYMRKFDFNFTPLSGDIPIYQGYDEILKFTAAQISNSRLMAAWSYDDTSTYCYDIRAKCFNLDNGDSSATIFIHYVANGQFRDPAIARIPGGGALIVWAAMFDQYDASIWGRRFDTLGVAIDPNAILLSCPDTNGGSVRIQQHPCITCDMTSGRYFLSWVENTDMLDPWNHILGRFFNSSIEPISDTFQINDSPSDNSSSPVASFWLNDTVFVAWDSYIDDYYQTDVFGDIVLVPDISIRSDEPQYFSLPISAYPNPFNSNICLKLSTIHGENSKLEIYDILGRCVKSFDLNSNTGHEQRVTWNAKDDNNIEVASGIYFVRLQSKTSCETRKINLIR